jgi:predicted acyl esterase
MFKFDSPGVDVIVGVRIPMRDGVHLGASVYKPKESKPPPAIFDLAPYGNGPAHPSNRTDEMGGVDNHNLEIATPFEIRMPELGSTMETAIVAQ